jgi:pyruvate kinase
MLTKIAAAVEPARRRIPVTELFSDVDLPSRLQSEHLVALAVEASFSYDRPAAIFVPTASGASARRIASLHLPVWTIAASASEATCQQLQFSRGVIALHVPNEPASWSEFARTWVRAHDLPGTRVLLAAGPSPLNPTANHRLEIVDL